MNDLSTTAVPAAIIPTPGSADRARNLHPTYTTTYLVDLGAAGEQYVIVTYHFTPGTPGRMHMANGDPGYPDEPAEMEVLTAVTDGGIDLSSLLVDTLQDDDALFSQACEERQQAWRDDREDFEARR